MKAVQPPAPPAMSVVGPREPPLFWSRLPPAPRPHNAEAWRYGSTLVLSSFHRMHVDVPYGPALSTDPVPVFHLAISTLGARGAARPEDRCVQRALAAFAMSDAQELPTKPEAVARQFVLSAA